MCTWSFVWLKHSGLHAVAMLNKTWYCAYITSYQVCKIMLPCTPVKKLPQFCKNRSQSLLNSFTCTLQSTNLFLKVSAFIWKCTNTFKACVDTRPLEVSSLTWDFIHNKWRVRPCQTNLHTQTLMHSHSQGAKTYYIRHWALVTEMFIVLSMGFEQDCKMCVCQYGPGNNASGIECG